jgi:UDPglucose 6-dehydrogenase
LAKTSSENDYDFKILEAVMSVNEDQKTKLIPTIKTHFNGDLKGKKIAMWGLAFKPYTDDIREAPALYNIEALIAAGAEIKAYDPEAMGKVEELIGDKITYTKGPYEALKDADALMIVTEWPQFRTPEFEVMEVLLKNKVIFDGRNLYDLAQMKEMGYTYYSIGRETVK